jgi:hypothetical protein
MGKKLFVGGAVVLGLYFLLHSPQEAATAVRAGGHLLGATLNALTTFLDSVAK